MDLGLTGKSALVIGGSAGIGLATARLLAAEGARVTIAARDRATLKDGASNINSTLKRHRHVDDGARDTSVQADNEVDWFSVDVTREDAHDFISERYADHSLDVLVVTVGGSIRGRFDSLDDHAWQDNYDINVLGPVRAARSLLPSLRKGRSPAIVLTGAAGAKMPYVNQVVSNVHKAGLLALVKTMSMELAGSGIRVNAISPGRTLTRLWLNRAERLAADRGCSPAEVIEEFTDGIPLGRFANPDEVANAIVFVASPRASYITGQSISVDGGIGRGLL